MTDTIVVTDTPPLVSDLPPTPDGKQPCSQCGSRYIPGPGMARHMSTAHGLPYDGGGTERVQCSRCDKLLAPSSLAKHLRVVHNVYQRRGRPPKNGNAPAVQARPKPRITATLTAEEITRAAALSLWPHSIPHDKVSALLAWHRQTAEFLEEVRNGHE